MKLKTELEKTNKAIFEKYFGQTIYFLCDDKMIQGEITGYDCFKFSVGKSVKGYGISIDQEFFLSEADLLEFLSKNKIVIS